MTEDLDVGPTVAQAASPPGGQRYRPVGRRDLALLVGVGAIACIAIWLGPALGLALGVLFTSAFLPYGTRLQDRVAVTMILLVSVVGVVVGIAGAPPTGPTVQAIVTGFVVVAAATNLLWGSPAARYPRVDVVTAIVSLVVVGVAASILWPFRGATDAQVLSGLIGGWDHSSHFAIFVGIHQQEVVGFMAHDSSGAMFSGYPSIYAQLWAMLTSAVLGGPESLTRAQLLGPYAVLSAWTVAVSCGLLTAVSADVARQLTSARSRTAASAAAAFACGVLILLGTSTHYFNVGHVNFLLAIAVAGGVSWYSVRTRDARRVWGPTLLLMGAVAIAGLYLPIAAAFIVSGVVVAGDLLGRSWLGLLGATLGALLVGVLLLVRAGFNPTGLIDHVGGLVMWTGGYPPMNASLALMSPLMVVALLTEAREGRTRLVAGAVSASTGLIAVVAGFVAVAALKAAQLHSSYYTMKLIGGLSLLAASLAATLVGLWFAAYLDRHQVGMTWRGTVRTIFAWLGLGAVLFASMGYFGPGGAYLPAGSPLAPGLTAFREREWLVTEVPEGDRIVTADQALTSSDAMPILWDGGDLKNNIWLSTLQRQLSSREHQLLSSLSAPFGEPAAQTIAAWLAEDGSRAVQVAYIRDESLPALERLVELFPGRVTLVRI